MLKIIKHIKVQVPVSKKNTNKIFHSHSPWSRSRQNRAAAILAQNAYGTWFFSIFLRGCQTKAVLKSLRGQWIKIFTPQFNFAELIHLGPCLTCSFIFEYGFDFATIFVWQVQFFLTGVPTAGDDRVVWWRGEALAPEGDRPGQTGQHQRPPLGQWWQGNFKQDRQHNIVG